MSSIQRRRGQDIKVWPVKLEATRRGDNMLSADMDATPHEVKAAIVPLRGSRAEIPGQQEIKIFTVILTAKLEGVDLQSRVGWAGEEWDVVSPQNYHHGTRATRHWSMDIRKRPTRPVS